MLRPPGYCPKPKCGAPVIRRHPGNKHSMCENEHVFKTDAELRDDPRPAPAETEEPDEPSEG